MTVLNGDGYPTNRVNPPQWTGESKAVVSRSRAPRAKNPLQSLRPVVETALPFFGDQISERSHMSQHPSLKSGGAAGAKRSVMKRFERVELLKKRGEWKEGNRVLGLKKTKPVS